MITWLDKEEWSVSEKVRTKSRCVLCNTASLSECAPVDSVDNGKLCAICAEVGITGGTIAKFMVMKSEVLR